MAEEKKTNKKTTKNVVDKETKKDVKTKVDKKESVKKDAKKDVKKDAKKDTKKEVAKKDAKKQSTKKKKAPKLAKPVPSKKIKDMNPKEKADFDKEMSEYKAKLQLEKNEKRALKKKNRDKKLSKIRSNKVLSKIVPERKKKAPKLQDPKLASDSVDKRTVRKRVDRKTKMMRRRVVGVVAMCVVVTAVVLGGFKLAGALELNAGYAAKTGDKYFTETEVSKYITEQTLYKSYSKSLSTWTQYLSTYGMTPEKFREKVIQDHFEHDELVRLAAEQEGIIVDENDVDKHVESFKAKYDKESEYKKALEDSGFTEESYREHTYQTVLEKNLIAKVVTTDAPSDDDVKTYLSSYSSAYKDARKSSHILFDSKDTDKAQSVLDQINAGTLTFEAAVAQYSIDEKTKANGGDRGWDKIENFSSSYNSGLSGMTAGEVNKTLVTDKEGIHIIKCTEKWDTPEKIESLDGVPQAIIEECRKKKDESNKTTKLEEWLKDFASNNGIVSEIFPMPKNVSYNVDMSKSTKASTSTSTSSSK